MEVNSEKILSWSRKLAALAQSGLFYCKDKFDQERYEEVQRVAAEMISSISDMEKTLLLNKLTLETGHATPKVDVRAACFNGDELLLVRELEDNQWSLPGGWAEVGMSPSESILKELSEEAGLAGTITKVLGIFNGDNGREPKKVFHEYRIIFLCEITGIQKSNSAPEEIAEVSYFPRDQIPSLSPTRTTPEQIELCFEWLEGNLPLGFCD